ncbi:hypothetical protein [Mycolicibacterium neoaurum]|uniref:hypothetical protein n=1 Tax=Mycolicibacterium neoaurum TaxID=1795 RepID=UPI001F4CD869|nr:hypothetical protein [Mycolicibacterium neoaurum]
MGFDTRPQRGRLKVSAPDAARLLQRDVRTIRRMIEDGEIAGGATSGGKQRRWWVYADQLPQEATDRRSSPTATGESDKGSEDTARTIAALSQQNQELGAQLNAATAANLELRVQLSSATEANQLLLAAQANLIDIVDQYRSSVAEAIGATDGYRQAADGYRDAAERYSQATAGFQATTDQLLRTVDKYREVLWQYASPGHPEGASR